MDRSLSKIVFFLLISLAGFSQTGTDADNVFRPQEYKNQEQFKHFAKRRNAVAKWQINQLKNGALIVRLHDNKRLVESLKKMGKADIATQKEYEAMAINKNIIKGFQRYYTFSKIYFIYSQNYDSLLKGCRGGIFVDSNLTVNNSIEMKESFYMLIEKDDIYNSSIGFVKEDTAKYIKETGNVTKHINYLVMKNKYGHQLKDPFPMTASSNTNDPGSPSTYIIINGTVVDFSVEKHQRLSRYCAFAKNLSMKLTRFYNENKDYEVTDPDIKPFLY